MKVSLVPAAQLDDRLRSVWAEIQRRDPRWDTPYLHPDFTRVVAEVRPHVEVAVLEEAGEVVGFFPFERRGKRTAQPVGLRLSDYQAVICRSGIRIDPAALLRACGLVRWDFDHLLVCQPEFAPYHVLHDESPILELTHGFDAYCRERAALGNDGLRDAERKLRKLRREVGEVRIVARSDDPEMLRTVCHWKSQQYQRTGLTDLFAYTWTRELLERLLVCGSPEFSGMLSVLLVNDRPAAVHMGMFSRGVLHYWFPTYDSTMSRYSPGCILLMELARFCQELGIRKIDMGRGVTPFKSRMSTTSVPVAAGSIDLRPGMAHVRNRVRRVEDWIRQSPYRPAARIPGRVLYRMRQWLAFR